MSAASVTAYLSPTMARNFATSSGESGGADGWTMFIFVSYVRRHPEERAALAASLEGCILDDAILRGSQELAPQDDA
jgi:hypothetical protein